MPAPEVQGALSPETLASLRICLVLILFVHLPVLGAVLGSAAVSLVANLLGRERRDPRYLRFSGELMQAASIDWKILVLLGLFPVPLLGLIHELLFSWRSPVPRSFWLLPAAGLAAAFFLIRGYGRALARNADEPGAGFPFGIGGFLAGTFALFLLWNGFGSAVNPEKAPLLAERIRYLVSWKSLVTFHQLLALFPGMAAAVIFIFVHAPAREKGDPDPGYGEIVRAWGRRLAWLSAVAVPALGLLGVAILPELALSPLVVAASAAVVLLSLAVVVLIPSEEGREGAVGARTLCLFSLMLAAMLVGEQAAIGNAFQGRLAAGKEAPAAAREPVPEGEPAAAPSAVEKGAEVFETACAGCHRFDIRVVGPPLDRAVPKYAGDLDRLKEFIRNPVRVDPDYPRMPGLGLSEEEIDAVARYLLERKPEGDEGANNPGGAAPRRRSP
jgi:mono/diheme cytochrome c family protein